MTLCTEDEAQEKWCPFARVTVGAVQRHAANRGDGGTDIYGATCIGSRCMSWRFDTTDTTPDGKARGYCGAFGKVEP